VGYKEPSNQSSTWSGGESGWPVTARSSWPTTAVTRRTELRAGADDASGRERVEIGGPRQPLVRECRAGAESTADAARHLDRAGMLTSHDLNLVGLLGRAEHQVRTAAQSRGTDAGAIGRSAQRGGNQTRLSTLPYDSMMNSSSKTS